MLSRRVHQTFAPPLVELGSLARATPGCISLGQGAPFYGPSQELFHEFYQSIDHAQVHRYSPDPGIPELREAIAAKLRADNKVHAFPEDIIVTSGANIAYVNTLLTLTDPGDKVILFTPYYFNHAMAASLLDLHVIEIPMNKDFTLPIKKLEEVLMNNEVKAVTLVNPGNPTGRVHSKQELDELVALLQGTQTWVISDETYDYFTYHETPHVSLASYADIKDQVITIMSFSKSFGIPGWRLGFYHGPENFIAESIKVQDTGVLCAPTISQFFGVKLLQERKQIIPKFKEYMQTNHDLAMELLETIPWLSSSSSQGAYYLFPESMIQKNHEDFAKELITKHKVYIVPGKPFGNSWKQHFRISFANSTPEELQEAFARLAKVSVH